MPGPMPIAVMLTARALAVDQVTGEVVAGMRRAGFPTILLKGPAIARWLYPEGGRSYADTDLLVAPGDVAAARRVLAGLGFQPREPAGGHHAAHAEVHVRAGAASRGPDVDLHRSLPIVRAGAERVWEVLSAGTVSMQVGGVEVAVLDHPARAFHVALHAAQHGAAVAKPLEDLRRAVATVDLDCWRQALVVARRLGAEDCLAAGLRLVPEGRALADELGLTGTVRRSVRLASTSACSVATLSQMADATTLQDWVEAVRGALLPSATSMRRRSPLARRGRTGLVLSYAARPVKLVRRLPLAVRTYRDTRGGP